MKQEPCNGVIAEVEIFEVDERLGIAYSLKHVFELVMSSLQESDGIAITNLDSFSPKVGCHDGIGCLSADTCHLDAKYQ